MPEKPATPEQQLDWLTFDLLAGTVVLEDRVMDTLASAEELLRDVKNANERLTDPEI